MKPRTSNPTPWILALLATPLLVQAQSPGASEAQLALWRSASFQKQFAESYLAETDVEPRITPADRDQMQEVLELIGKNQLEQARALVEKRCGEAANALYDFTLGNLCFQLEKPEQALAAYARAVAKHPKFRRAWRNLAVLHVQQGEHKKALPALTRVLELGGGDAVTYGLLGFSHMNVGDDIAAESAYRMAVLLDPVTIDWKMGLARSFFRQQRYAEAVSLCGRLIDSHPDRADLWLLQANAYIGLSQPRKAAENYELVDRLGQSTADSLKMLGDIYVNDQLFDLAVQCYVRALDKQPQGSAERAIRAAKALVAHGALSESKTLIARIEALPRDQLPDAQRKDLLKLRARLAVAAGAGEEEAKALEEVVALDPLDGEALLLLGQHRSRAGDLEKAIFYYERAASLEAFEADAKVRHAQLLVGQGRYADALPLLRRAQVLKPRDHVQDYLEQVARVAQTR
jgi:tetratricopeptide (TPR) repeat protein